MTDALWQLGGWTMLHFFWVGTGVAVVGAAVRFACRRSAPGVRYAVSLVVLALLAALPLGIAGWLYSPAILAGSDRSAALPFDALKAGAPSQDGSAIYAEAPRVIDLAFADPAVADAAPMLPVVDATAALPWFATVVTALPWVWLAGAPLTFALLAAGLVGSERLRRTSAALVEGPAAAACERLRQAMRITRRVSVAVCDGVAQPVLVGIVQPLILLPAAAMSGWTPQELEMVLMHELAHVRRWDNLVNLGQRIVESALFFHPAVWLASRQVRRDREECCDAIVVARTERPHDYAALLVSIAAKMQVPRPAALAAASAMADHPLAGRVRRILKLEDESMAISRGTLGATAAAAVLGIVLAGAVVYQSAAAAEERRAETVTEERRAETEEERDAVAEKESAAATKMLESETSEAAVASELKKKLTEWQIERKAAESESNDLEAVSQATQARLTKQMDSLKEKKSAKDRLDPDVEIPLLQATIARLEGLIAKENQNLANVEVFKQLALQNARSSAAVESAVAASLQKDPTFAAYQQKLFKLQEVVQGHSEEWKQANDEQRKQFLKQLRQTAQEMQQHRAAAEKAAREQIAKMPNEAFRAAIVEHKIRYESAMANLKKYEEELGEAKRRLEQWSVQYSDQDRASAPAKPQAAFPSLEEQKIADRAFKLLGIDFEPVDADKLARVKELGYDGGLRIAGFGNIAGEDPQLQGGDILVGLYVWPTANLKALDAILVRKDLNELAPLKYRVVRSPSLFEDGPGGKAEVFTGRIGVKRVADEVDAQNQERATQEEGPFDDVSFRRETPQGLPGQPHAALPLAAWPPQAGTRESYFYSRKPNNRETTYLYDGKTFEDWRSLWKNELKTERRIEAIEALAAFGRAGQGKEAAEAIFEVADQYDPTAGLGPGESKLVTSVINVVALLPSSDWMPLVLERLAEDDSTKKQHWRAYAAAFLNGARPRPEDREVAMKFAEHAEGELTVSLASYALRGDPELADPGTVELVRKGLREEPTDLSLLYQLNLGHVDKTPEQIALLLHPEAGARARDFIRPSAQDRPGLAAILTDPLLAILDDPERQGEHVAALRALRALSPALRHRDMQEHAARVVERLGRLLQEGDDELAIPAYVALYHVKKGASMENLADVLLKEGVLTADRAEKLQGIDHQAFIDESNEE